MKHEPLKLPADRSTLIERAIEADDGNCSTPPTPQPTPQQPTEASPSAEAMEAARKYLCQPPDDAFECELTQRRCLARTLDAFARAHFAREFAKRVEEAERMCPEEDVGGYTPKEITAAWERNRGRAATFAALRALGGEGGKR
jgi:hypothetical protein